MAAPSGLQLTLAAIGILLCIRFPGRTATTQRTGSGPQPCRTDNAAMQHCRLIAQLNITSFQASGMRPGTRGALDMNFMDELKRRRDYNRTVRELRRLPMDVALDLGIYQGDARAIARRAVYGK